MDEVTFKASRISIIEECIETLTPVFESRTLGYGTHESWACGTALALLIELKNETKKAITSTKEEHPFNFDKVLFELKGVADEPCDWKIRSLYNAVVEIVEYLSL